MNYTITNHITEEVKYTDNLSYMIGYLANQDRDFRMFLEDKDQGCPEDEEYLIGLENFIRYVIEFKQSNGIIFDDGNIFVKYSNNSKSTLSKNDCYKLETIDNMIDEYNLYKIAEKAGKNIQLWNE